jgi:hypothetical protein
MSGYSKIAAQLERIWNADFSSAVMAVFPMPNQAAVETYSLFLR